MSDATTRGASKWRALGLVLVGLVLGLATAALVFHDPMGLAGSAESRAGVGGETGPTELWTCGMDPEVLQDEPGTCPICHMDLTPLAIAEEAGGADVALFTCPMDPEILSEEPGSCPICGMDLVPVDVGDDSPGGRDAHAAHGHAGAAAGATFECPLHPEDISRDEPGTCPICGLELVEKAPAAASSPPSTRPVSGEPGRREILYYRHPHDPMITSLEPRKDEMGMDFVPIHASLTDVADGPVVTVQPGIVQSMNVVLGRSRRGDLLKEIRTVGTLDFDQAKMVSVTTKYRGFVETVHANYLGQTIRRGDALFDVYSPELVQTQEELLSALRYAERMSGASEDARRRAGALVDAARSRLAFWDVSTAQVHRVERTQQPMRTITVTSPATGVIMKRTSGLEGIAITPGMDVLHVANLDTLWLEVQVYEDQLRWVDAGSQARVTFAGSDGEPFTGRVRYVEPQIDERTRTATVAVEVPNASRKLRVGQYADVTFSPVALRDVVLVPSAAVMRTGERDLVVRALGDGRFAPREVVLGPESNDETVILDGLSDGEDIVVSGQFLLASESRLREAVLKMLAQRRKE